MTSQSLPEPVGGPITLAEAMTRTNYFRQAAKGLFNNNVNLVPKGFVISFTDIVDLMQQFTDPSVVGVRAYFTLSQPEFSGGIKGILVPVTEVEAPDGSIIYKDLIVNYATKKTVVDGDEDAAIFDFTKPCPDACDVTSPLC